MITNPLTDDDLVTLTGLFCELGVIQQRGLCLNESDPITDDHKKMLREEFSIQVDALKHALEFLNENQPPKITSHYGCNG